MPFNCDVCGEVNKIYHIRKKRGRIEVLCGWNKTPYGISTLPNVNCKDCLKIPAIIKHHLDFKEKSFEVELNLKDGKT